MNFRRDVLWVIAALLLTASIARSETASATVARIHWLGKTQLAAETNAAHFLSVWNLPESVRLESQTLDKLSRWAAGGPTNPATAALRPLLDDLVSAESYLEVRAATNSQLSAFNSQMAFALRLPAARAQLWQTNLATALESLTGIPTVAAPGGRPGWSLKKHHAPDLIELARVGEWTVVGAATGTNALLAELRARLEATHAPCARSATNFWLEADLDLRKVASLLLQPSPVNLQPSTSALWSPFALQPSTLRLSLIGDGENVLSRGELNFAAPLNLSLAPWQIPTNLIHQPLNGFLAVRGIGPWLAALPVWPQLQFRPPPDQLFSWSHKDVPFETYIAAPLPEASNQIHQLADRLVQKGNPWLATHGEGSFHWEANLPGLTWHDAYIINPFLRPVTADQRDFVLAGLVPFNGKDPNPPPAETIRTVLHTPDLVYYQAELTGSRLEDGLFMYQLGRLLFHKAQLPATAAGTLWMKSAEPVLGPSSTSVIQTGDRQLVLTRKSTIGFTATELHLLTDWLESPQFPHGLHTLLAPPEK